MLVMLRWQRQSKSRAVFPQALTQCFTAASQAVAHGTVAHQWLQRHHHRDLPVQKDEGGQ